MLFSWLRVLFIIRSKGSIAAVLILIIIIIGVYSDSNLLFCTLKNFSVYQPFPKYGGVSSESYSIYEGAVFDELPLAKGMAWAYFTE